MGNRLYDVSSLFDESKGRISKRSQFEAEENSLTGSKIEQDDCDNNPKPVRWIHRQALHPTDGRLT